MEKIVAVIFTGPYFSIFDEDIGEVVKVGEHKLINGIGYAKFREWYKTINEAQKGLLKAAFIIDLY